MLQTGFIPNPSPLPAGSPLQLDETSYGELVNDQLHHTSDQSQSLPPIYTSWNGHGEEIFTRHEVGLAPTGWVQRYFLRSIGSFPQETELGNAPLTRDVHS